MWSYCRDKRTRKGPVTFQELQRLARSGQLTPTDMVQQHGTTGWVTAGSLPGLFASSPSPAQNVSTAVAFPAPSTAKGSPPRQTAKVNIPVWVWIASIPVAFVTLCCGGCMTISLLGSAMRDEPKKQVASADSTPKQPSGTRDKPRDKDKVVVQPPPQPEKEDAPAPAGARRLRARVNTEGQLNNPVVVILNKCIVQMDDRLVVYAADNQLTLKFDFAGNKNADQWTKSQDPHLLIRVFDEDGEYLTHFTTKEIFTRDKAWADDRNAANSVLPAAIQERWVVVKDKSNVFSYNVAKTYLREAAIVEVGFWFQR
jgi:hypothetical protein